MERALKALMAIMPLLFAVGFLAPVIAATMAVLDIEAPFAMSRIGFALTMASAWGLVAVVKGRWI